MHGFPILPNTALPSRLALVVLAVVALAVSGCGDKKKDKAATQTAAKVNKEEITVHQINFVLQQQRGLRPEQADAASRQILDRLIDQELAVQKASELKLDRDPRVVQQIEGAKREIIARAYLERIGEAASKPTADEVQQYYDSRPALFKERRVYSIQELAIEATPDQMQGLRDKLAAAKSLDDFVAQLKAADFKFSGNQAVRAAEHLPLASLDAFAKMRDGQATFTPTATGAQVVFLAGSRMQPVTLEQSRPAIEQFLLNERKREMAAKDLKDMRSAAKIEYIGKFAEAAASAPAGAATGTPGAASEPAAAPAPVAAPAPAAAPPAAAASALDSSSISKGMGLK